jgi:ParB/RepB/Spo0J family partition protein
MIKTPENGTKITEVRWLKLDQVLIGEFQPRTDFEKAGIDELVESFRQHGFRAGVSQLLVRPLGEYRIEHSPGSTHYFVQRRMNRDWETVETADSEAEAKAKMIDVEQFELVCGERRLRASEIVELKRVPAVVEDMDDLSVLKLQLIENLQRKSLNAMEEGLAYRRLMGMGQTREEIAKSVGFDVKHVDERLALCRLEGTPAATAIETGAITPTHGKLLARVPSAALRNELLQKVLHPPDGSTAPWPYRALAAHIKLDYVKDLRKAKFDQTDASLVPVKFEEGHEGENEYRLQGGACTDNPLDCRCPFNVAPTDVDKRSSARMCMNLECFRLKEGADHEKWRQGIVAPGRETLAAAENAELWNESGTAVAYHSPYVELLREPERSELRSDAAGEVEVWKKLIEDQAVPIIVGRDALGRAHELVKHDLAKKAAHLNGHLIFRDSVREQKTDEQRSSTAPAPAQSRDEKSEIETLAAVERRQEEGRIKQAEIAAIVAAAEGKECRGQFRLPKAFYEQLLFTLLSVGESFAVGESSVTLTQAVMGGRGLELDEAAVTGLTIGQQFGLAVEMLVALEEQQKESWAGVFAVDLKAVRKAAAKKAANVQRPTSNVQPRKEDGAGSPVKEKKAA